MKNKVLVKLLVPELGCNFDVFIPVNEILWKIKKMMIKSIMDLTGITLDVNGEYALINKLSYIPYDNNAIIINTDIRNATELVLVSIKDNNQSLVNVKMQ